MWRSALSDGSQPLTATDPFLLFLQAETDGTVNAVGHNIVDSLAAKVWANHLATEAALSVLSTDGIIMTRTPGGPKIPQQAGNWDEIDAY